MDSSPLFTDWLNSISTAVVAFGAALALGIAYIQLKGIRKQTGLQALTQALDEFRSEDARRDRKILFQEHVNLEQQGRILDLEWARQDQERRSRVERVLVSYNRIGFLVDSKLAPMNKNLADYLGPPNIRMWEVLRCYVNQERKRRGEEGFCIFFEHLAEQCKKKLPKFKAEFFSEEP